MYRIQSSCPVLSCCLFTGYQGIAVMITGIISCHHYNVAGNLLKHRLSYELALEMLGSCGSGSL